MSDTVDQQEMDKAFAIYQNHLARLCEAYNNVAQIEERLRFIFGVNWETQYEYWKRDNHIPKLYWHVS